ncbi:hypothetical protein [Aeromicrobium sp. CTD01-1L150]|uniref:hypothetical protein n=1 Tax=Aeromicrobium sp. CTD01-1L150 TaxID=3341830 RepID=UPI0035BF9664
MTRVRAVLGTVGVALIAVGVLELRGSDATQLLSALLWLGGGVVVHDVVVAPLTVLVVLAGSRWAPRSAHGAAVVGLVVWGTVTIATANVLLGVGGKPDNPTLLNRPYVEWWLALSVLWWAGVVGTAWWLNRLPSRAPLRRRDGS